MGRRKNYKEFGYRDNCESCGKKLELNEYGRYPKRFCSQECNRQYSVGSKSWNFKTGIVRGNVYIRILVGGKNRYMPEHRYLVEKLIGRKLLSGEVVHHIDGNKKNNDISNLRLMTNGEHVSLHNLNIPRVELRRFPVLSELPNAIEENKIVSLLPNYRTYITVKCPGCGKLFWSRKDHKCRTDHLSCSQPCAHKYRREHGLYKSRSVNNL